MHVSVGWLNHDITEFYCLSFSYISRAELHWHMWGTLKIQTECHPVKYVLELKHLPAAFTSANTQTEKSDVTKNHSLLVFLFIYILILSSSLSFGLVRRFSN
jgi:hypothetical protein